MNKTINARETIEKELESCVKRGDDFSERYHSIRARTGETEETKHLHRQIVQLRGNRDTLKWVLSVMDDEGRAPEPAVSSSPKWTLASIFKAISEGKFSEVLLSRAADGSSSLHVTIIGIGTGKYVGRAIVSLPWLADDWSSTDFDGVSSDAFEYALGQRK